MQHKQVCTGKCVSYFVQSKTFFRDRTTFKMLVLVRMILIITQATNKIQVNHDMGFEATFCQMPLIFCGTSLKIEVISCNGLCQELSECVFFFSRMKPWLTSQLSIKIFSLIDLSYFISFLKLLQFKMKKIQVN